jgi:AcrR family transcriptional regulator
MQELPLIGAPAPERADAARNRQRILSVAARLFAEQGVECTSMDAIAAAAGVGKGTLFRRFGDRTGLVIALLDDQERRFQDEILSGPPPLGPGVPAQERIQAFLDALLAKVDEQTEVLVAAESGSRPGARFRSPVYNSWHRHLTLLLHEFNPELDGEILSHVLLSPVAADLHRHMREVHGLDLERIRAAQHELLRLVFAE